MKETNTILKLNKTFLGEKPKSDNNIGGCNLKIQKKAYFEEF